MKAMEFLTLLGELDEGAVADTAPVVKKKQKKRRALWVAAAAGLCACLLGFSAWFFLPPMNISSEAGLTMTMLRIDSRLAAYYEIKTDRLSPFERSRLPNTPGDILCVHGDTTFYCVADTDDLHYLLGEVNGKYTLYAFENFFPLAGVDMSESVWYDTGWLTDEDLAALDYETVPTMEEILTVIYGVTEGKNVKTIRFDKSSSYRGGVTKKVKVSPVTVKDTEDVERLYGLLAAMAPVSIDDREKIDFGTVNIHDEAYLNGQAPLSAQINRRVTVTMNDGHSLVLNYYPATGILYQQGSDLYTILSDTDNQWLIDLAGIDMSWHDWGTEMSEKATDGKEEGDETATVPAYPLPQAS